MKSLVKYAKKAKEAYEEYVKNNGLDNLADRVYNSIQNIESLDEKEKSFLDRFIGDYSFSEVHLADVIYVGDGEKSVFASLLRMKPIKLSQTNGRIYEARENSFDFVFQNNGRKPIKVFQKVR